MRKRREKDRARRAAQTAGERQATSQQRSTCERERMAAETPEERENEDYSRKVPVNVKEWQLKTSEEREGRLQRMSTNQHEKLAGKNPRKERRKITADEHQPVRKVGS